MFVSIDRNKTSGSSDILDSDQDFINVSLSLDSKNDRYTSEDIETDSLQGGQKELIGLIKKKYDFIKDINPFKILITRVTSDQSLSYGNLLSEVDSNSGVEYWDILDGNGLSESLVSLRKPNDFDKSFNYYHYFDLITDRQENPAGTANKNPIL